MRRLLAFCCLALFALSATADTIYKSRDAQGRVVYSDQPRPGADTQTQLPPLNTMEPGQTQAQPQSAPRQTEEEPIRYQVRIDAPVQDSSVPPGQRDLTISVSVEPQLQQGHYLAFYQNNDLLEETRRSQLIIEEIFRGSHTLEVDVIDEDGRILGSSEPVVVHVHRPSLHSPARQ
ncbi:DUF4124 domain-containing protein [Marinimicrobium sp. ABcell2]|uniref:DUF4124 domain-containing protein n=1 Tax=Marinimicrobium sp. ABcell2 TaxID=3069751 RepID=UPI0027B38B74|nr:DUF4124 domain-containing protein [Marinimicrobium sp. ABcell2]MDQ2076031.1 DUF4124 domain-containing protein [Marinimicrobium sp. ABcell2]